MADDQRDYAEEAANRREAESEREPEPGALSRAEMFDTIIAGVRAGGIPVPRRISFVEAPGTVPALTLCVDDVVDVVRWAGMFSLRWDGESPHGIEGRSVGWYVRVTRANGSPS